MCLMKKKLGNILIFVLIIGLTIGYGIYKDDQSRATVNKIYTTQFQEQALSDLENEKGNGKANGRGCSAAPFAKAC